MSTVDFFNFWYAFRIRYFSAYDTFETVRFRLIYILLAAITPFLCSDDGSLPTSYVLFSDCEFFNLSLVKDSSSGLEVFKFLELTYRSVCEVGKLLKRLCVSVCTFCLSYAFCRL